MLDVINSISRTDLGSSMCGHRNPCTATGLNLVRAWPTHGRTPRHRVPGMPTKLFALIAALTALVLLPLSAGTAQAQKRVALVIGNSVYQTVPRLANPVNDATVIAQMFKNAGFDSVTLRRDLSAL